MQHAFLSAMVLVLMNTWFFGTRTANFCTLQEGGLIRQSCKGGEEVKMKEATRNGVGEGPESIINLLKMQQHKN